MAPAPARHRRLVLALLCLEALLVLAFAFGTSQSRLMDVTGINDFTLHLLAFGLAAALAGSIFRPLPVAIALCGFAAFIEAVQFFIEAREASLTDLLVGGLGIAAGLALAHGLSMLARGRRA